LEERPAGFEEVTNRNGKVLLLNSAIDAENEPLGGSTRGDDATSGFTLLFFNF
jgi:hypothetical protein